MGAVEQYFDHIGQHGRIEAAYPAAVVSGQTMHMASPQLYGNPRANENAQMQGNELLAAVAMSECPVFRQMMDDHRTAQEALHAVHQSLTFILRGNKAMYVPADEMQGLMDEMARHVEEFKRDRKLNPGTPVAKLHAKIGPGSHFAHRYRLHLEQHHPDHPATHEPYADGKPKPHVFGMSAEHAGRINGDMFHFYGYPSEHM